MITLLHPYGNHSNRLIQNLHFQAFCISNNIKYANPSLHDIAHLYRKPADTRDGVPPPPASFDLILFFQKEKGNYSDHLLSVANLNCGVGGWGFRFSSLEDQLRKDLIEAYSLKPHLYHDLLLYRSLIAAREQGRKLIGIHIRRSDYKSWAGGRYFFDDQTYSRVINDMRALIEAQTQCSCMFVLFGDEPITIEPEADVMISGHQWHEDHALMGICDYVIGPPSTFSIWACFIGGAKLLHLQTADQNVTLESFTKNPII